MLYRPLDHSPECHKSHSIALSTTVLSAINRTLYTHYLFLWRYSMQAVSVHRFTLVHACLHSIVTILYGVWHARDGCALYGIESTGGIFDLPTQVTISAERWGTIWWPIIYSLIVAQYGSCSIIMTQQFGNKLDASLFLAAVNDCLSVPCQNNGKCKDRVAGYECVCIEGFTGIHCSETGNT